MGNIKYHFLEFNILIKGVSTYQLTIEILHPIIHPVIFLDCFKWFWTILQISLKHVKIFNLKEKNQIFTGIYIIDYRFRVCLPRFKCNIIKLPIDLVAE